MCALGRERTLWAKPPCHQQDRQNGMQCLGTSGSRRDTGSFPWLLSGMEELVPFPHLIPKVMSKSACKERTTGSTEMQFRQYWQILGEEPTSLEGAVAEDSVGKGDRYKTKTDQVQEIVVSLPWHRICVSPWSFASTLGIRKKGNSEF